MNASNQHSYLSTPSLPYPFSFLNPKTGIAFLLFVSLFHCGLLYAQEDTELNFTSRVRALDCSPVLMECNGQNSLEYWDKDYLMIRVTVKVKNQKTATINKVVGMGRYKLAYDQDRFILAISTPDLRRKVLVNGREYEEEISYKIYAPRGTVVAHLRVDPLEEFVSIDSF